MCAFSWLVEYHRGRRSQGCQGFLGSKECPLEDKSGSGKTLLTPWVFPSTCGVLWTPSSAPRARAISCPPLCDAVLLDGTSCAWSPLWWLSHGTPGKGCLSLVASSSPQTLASVHWLRATRRLVYRAYSSAQPHMCLLTRAAPYPTPIQLLTAVGESTENLKETR